MEQHASERNAKPGLICISSVSWLSARGVCFARTLRASWDCEERAGTLGLILVPIQTTRSVWLHEVGKSLERIRVRRARLRVVRMLLCVAKTSFDPDERVEQRRTALPMLRGYV